MGLTKPRAAQIFNLDYKQATRVVTTVAVTLSGGAPSSVDGVSLSAGDRVLVTAQGTGSQNGLYYVVTVGSGATGTWARTSDGNDNGEIEAGMIVMVTEGTIYADTQWKLITDDPITIGTTALTFTQNYMANSISGGTSNVVVNSNANVTISSSGTANVLTVSSTGTVVTGTESVTGNITGGNIRTAGLISATGNITGGNISATSYTGTNVSVTGTVTAASTVGGVITGSTASVTGTITAASTVGGIITGSTASLSGNVTGGNISTAGQVSATGNVTGGNIVTSGSGGALSGTGNITGGNVLTGGVVSATGNITGNYFLGNVFYANGITASKIYNGTSEANVGTSGGNANISIGGTSNVVVFASTGEYVTGLLSVTGNVTGGNIVTSGSGGALSGTGNITGGNVLTSGIMSSTGNITGNYILGNVFYATGITASKIYNGTSEANVGTSGGNANISIGGTSNVVVFASTGEYVTGLLSVTGNVTGGNIVTSGSGGALSGTGNITGGNVLTAGVMSSTGNATHGNVLTGGSISATGNLSVAGINVSGNIVPTANNVYTLGTPTAVFQHLYVGPNSLYLGGNSLSSPNGVLTWTTGGASGNILMTSGPPGTMSASGNVYAGNVINTGYESVTGNVIGGNILTGGQVSATGNITGNYFLGNVACASGIYASRIFNGTSEANIATSGGNANISIGGTSNVVVFATTGQYTTGVVSATGNVTGGNIVAATAITNGNITITGANIVSTGPTLYIDPNGSGGTDGNVIITGNLSVQGNVTYINSNNVTTNDLTINVANNASSAAQANGGGIGVGPAGSEYISLTYNSTSNIWVASNGLTSQGILSATGNITGGNVLTSGIMSSTGNATHGNILTTGLVSATGNITGNYHIGNGSQLTGISAFSNVAVANGNSILANSISSTLTLSAGSGITLVATPGTGVITIATSSGGSSIFATGGDMGTVTETVTASEDLGLVTDAVTVSYDLGSVVSASGLIYPSQLILPAYTPATLPGASPAAQFVYLSTSSIGAMTAFSDGTNWRFTSSGNIVS